MGKICTIFFPASPNTLSLEYGRSSSFVRALSFWPILLFSLPLCAQLPNHETETVEQFLDRGEYKRCMEHIKKLDAQQVPGSPHQAHARLLSTLVYREMGKPFRAEAITDSLLRTEVFSENKELLAKAWLLKGLYSVLLKKDETALQYYLKVDSLTENNPNMTEQRAWALNNIGELLFDSRYASAQYKLSSPSEWYEKAFIAAKKTKDSVLWYRIATNRAFSQSFKHGTMPESVPEVFPEALNYYKKYHKTRQLNKVYYRLALLHLFTGNTGEALRVCEDYIAYMTRNKRPDLCVKGWMLTGTIHNLSGMPDESIKAFEKGIELMDDPDVVVTPSEHVVLLTQLAEAYKANEQYKEALKTTEQLKALNDSLLRATDFEKVKELETRYQTEKKEQEITLLKTENELKAQQQKNQRNVLLGIAGIACLGGIFFFVLWRHRQKTNKKLLELDQFKSRFFANVSHEFRTPLTLITAPLDRQLEKPSLSAEDEKDFTLIQQNATRLLTLVDQLLDLSKLESGHWRLRVGQGNLGLLLRNLTEAFQYPAEKKNMDYRIDIPETGLVWFDRDTVEKILSNLLSNAFKYTPNGGFVSFWSKTEGDHIKLYVENSGASLSKEEVGRLFERFYQAGDNEGTGIGLALVKELVTLCNGHIVAELIGKENLRFTLTLPIERKRFSEEEIVENVTEAVHAKNTIDQVGKTRTMTVSGEMDLAGPYHQNSPILLVVEDNEDLRKYICATFSDQYKIIEAENGQEGIDKALDTVPDIVISDIMMPGKSGLELCKTLKADPRTSHVPIILLTAKSGDDDHYTGLQTGADDYIAKPFRTRLLEQKVKNIVASRERIRERYRQELVLVPKDLAVTAVDKTFFEKVQAVLDAQLTAPSFSTEEFSKAVGMSRMQLHRKLKAMTGSSTSEFIRSQRLKLATHLLMQSDANISEIGYMVGFSDPSYFSKCFREMFHCTPTEYAEKHKI